MRRINMYNQKKAQVTSHEKMLREHKVDPGSDDNQAIGEKELPHREGDKYTITEDQIDDTAKVDDSPIIEKVLSEAESYVQHRSEAGQLSVPPINALVEKLQQDRMKEWDTKKESHWSLEFNDKKQQGSLPRLSKNAPQHDKIVLNNDPRRFEGASALPTSTTQSENDVTHGEKPDITPLVGKITRADIHNVAEKIKKGASVEYDAAIVAILREADKDTRELTGAEKEAIGNLKVARTKAMLKK